MADAAKARRREWISRCYLEKLPKYDPDLYVIVRMSSNTAHLRFETAFNMLLFLNQVVCHSIYNGVAWDSMTISLLPNGKTLLSITVHSRARDNRMNVIFKSVS